MADSGGCGERQIRIAEGELRMKPPFIQHSECSRQCNLIPSSFMTPDRGEMKDVSLPLLPHRVPVFKTLQSSFCLYPSTGSTLTECVQTREDLSFTQKNHLSAISSATGQTNEPNPTAHTSQAPGSPIPPASGSWGLPGTPAALRRCVPAARSCLLAFLGVDAPNQ
ncbi:SH3 domain-binding glutamic acid-rich-like protein 2 isoform X1 [Homo sapiens]|uniref:SH3 domain binding glutamate rich protein like 2 n=1 Tax=Homo sapiens TaxID=9606 RepID=A0ABB0MV85_HUMAN|nr:SH3 domain-binding glutamic acid-rich-like protein 2 isoform X1 [Homo sapiens]XP_054212482.1 SH3 domain-binding glutamic acid-rich-like protein 2 isoform X1 [Homo sapiens]|eukprot:XP_011534584.1 uncharacterized protein LOC112267857 isoform X1 [Homo sapiens]